MYRKMGTNDSVVYYSDIGLYQHGVLKERAPMRLHRARIKALLLLCDAVHVPMSHLLNVEPAEFGYLINGMADFISDGLFRSKYSVNSPDLVDYVESFKQRPGNIMKNDELNDKRIILANVDDLSAYSGGMYSGDQQTELFNNHMKELLLYRLEKSDVEFDLDDIVSALNSNMNKEQFDKFIAEQFHQLESVNKLQIREMSDYIYYYVGSESNDMLMSANGFLNRGRSIIASLPAPAGHMMGNGAYDPALFADFLFFSNAINSIYDLDKLTSHDIVDIKRQSGYQKFIDAYLKLYSSAERLTDIYAADEELRKGFDSEGLHESFHKSITWGLIICSAILELVLQAVDLPDEPSLRTFGNALRLVLATPGAYGLLQLGRVVEPSKPKTRKGIAERIALTLEGRIAPMHQFTRQVNAAIKNRS